MSREETPANPDHGWLSAGSTNPDEVATYYNDWATDYNETLSSWDYRAPREAAKLMQQHVSTDRRILDAGCGTGLSGRALHDAGYRDLVGIDISTDSLVHADKTGVYQHVHVQNLQEVPFPFDADSFDAIACVGVLAYVADPAKLFREFCRLVTSNGYVVLTQRDDWFASQDYHGVLAALEDEGLWETILVSEPQLYLPNNDDFSDRIRVIYIVTRVR